MNKCRRNAARKRRGMDKAHGGVKLNVTRYSEDRVELLMKLIRMEIGQ